MDGRPLGLIVTCEHGGRRVPAGYGQLFAGHEIALGSHRGYDPGALDLATRLAARLGAPLFGSEITRLLVDLNRSPRSVRLFSEFSRMLPAEERERLLAVVYRPHRQAIAKAVGRRVSRGARVLHVAVHTFTPVLDGHVRRADLGLLYDPSRSGEREFAKLWRQTLRNMDRGLVVRRNYPYLGVADGLTTDLRKRFQGERYLGVELEVNQRFPTGAPEPWERLQQTITESLTSSVAHLSRRTGSG